MINNSPEDNLEITDNNNNIIGFAIKRNANICTFKVYFKKFLAWTPSKFLYFTFVIYYLRSLRALKK